MRVTHLKSSTCLTLMTTTTTKTWHQLAVLVIPQTGHQRESSVVFRLAAAADRFAAAAQHLVERIATGSLDHFFFFRFFLVSFFSLFLLHFHFRPPSAWSFC